MVLEMNNTRLVPVIKSAIIPGKASKIVVLLGCSITPGAPRNIVQYIVLFIKERLKR
jgi:hypothetical protein